MKLSDWSVEFVRLRKMGLYSCEKPLAIDMIGESTHGQSEVQTILSELFIVVLGKVEKGLLETSP